MPIQQMLLGVGAADSKNYVDDVFSTYVYEGDGTTSHQIINGIDLATHGGLIWGKERGNSGSHYQFDTVRGLNKRLKSNSDSAEETDTFYSSVNSNGYTINKTTSVNVDGNDYASWSFRRAKGFFDVVSYTGNATAGRTVNHSLGCVPGLIMVKKISESGGDWAVLHKSEGATKVGTLNSSGAFFSSTFWWNNTEPTSTQFTLGNSEHVNDDGEDFVAYLFAGGESTAATARSVDFDGSNDSLNLAASNDFIFTGDLTIECWVKPDSYGNANQFWCLGDYTASNGVVCYMSDELYLNQDGNDRFGSPGLPLGQWSHVAVVRSGSTVTMYVNGTSVGSYTNSTNWGSTSNRTFRIGAGNNGGSHDWEWDGKISNLRVVNGTAVYTSSFKPPTEPLTNITNTKLLCCNNSSTTGSTVTPGTITANSSPTASSDSPFDDPAAFTFGENKDQNVIKCGSYKGDSSSHSNPTEVNVGFEPQWILVKNATSTANWVLVDSMRKWTGDSADGVQNVEWFEPNTNDAAANGSMLTLTSTGFIARQSSYVAGNNTFIYVAVRRPDGYVGKPPELGTGVFAMGTGASSSTIPNYTSGFPVDFSFRHNTTGTSGWQTSARLIQGKAVWLNLSNTEISSSGEMFDSNVGYGADNNGSNFQNWMFKRHAGFDVVTWTGDDVRGRQIPHSLSKTPEMMWIKSRSAGYEWIVYHKGLNGGTNPEQKYLRLDGNNAEATANVVRFNNQAPTSTHFIVGEDGAVNAIVDGSGATYIAMLFASVDGISKVGYYSGSNSSQTISTGFAPRFLVMKKVDTTQGWVVLDTVRGWGSGGDERLEFHNTSAQNDNIDFGAPTSSGFTLEGNVEKSNQSGGSYIYYAHA